MHKILLICVACLTLSAGVAAQEKANYQTAEELHREVTFLLLNKNIHDVTRQLDSESPATVASLFRRLVIYRRAGQTSRVRKTLEQLASVANWQCAVSFDLKTLLRYADGDNLDIQRFYYERLCPDDTYGAEAFVTLWTSNGDLKELDTWLAERSTRNDEWLMQRVRVRAKSGTAGELLDALAAEIRANPSDWTRLDRYLKANNNAGNSQNLGWLADTFEVGTAGDYFRLAQHVRDTAPEAGVKLLLKSLDVPFTDSDAKFVYDLFHRFRSVSPSIKVNLEKQLRYWTKRSLAETYQRMNQSLAAQPLVEELVSMKGDDVELEDVHSLAGAVQSASGQRVVETKILGDEAAQRSTSEYWLKRAWYYHGRDEFGLERESYRQALVALPARPQDINAMFERLAVVRAFAFFLAEEPDDEEDQPELEKLLTRELSAAPPDTIYAFRIAELFTQNEFRVDDLRNSLLAKRPSFFARLLDGQREWDQSIASFIDDIVAHEGVPAELRQKLWSSLEQLVSDPGSPRAHYLAEAMIRSNEWPRAIPLLRGYIQHASSEDLERYQSDAINDLFTAYCRTKQWQAAEKLVLAHSDSFWRGLSNTFGEVALVAAQQNAIDDAMRLWRRSNNFDQPNLEILQQLAQTKAKPQLLAMYLQMKKDDPFSTIPDLALPLLK